MVVDDAEARAQERHAHTDPVLLDHRDDAGAVTPVRNARRPARIPSTGDLLLVWNNSPDKRFPLTSAISKDDGKTWQHIKNLDEDPAHTYAYTSIEFLKDRALFTYYAGPQQGVRGEGRWSLNLKAAPIDWFYK